MDARFQDLIERIQNAKFRTTRLSPGYDEREAPRMRHVVPSKTSLAPQ